MSSVGGAIDLSKRVGNGEDTSFWNEAWAGEGSLRDRFNRLFQLSSKEGKVRSLGSGEREYGAGNGIGGVISWIVKLLCSMI